MQKKMMTERRQSRENEREGKQLKNWKMKKININKYLYYAHSATEYFTAYFFALLLS